MTDHHSERPVAPSWRRMAQFFRQTLAVSSLLVAISALPAAAQWSSESPLPTHLSIRGVAAPAAGRVFLATDDDSFDASGHHSFEHGR